MSCKVALLLFCVVVITECQFLFPGNYFSPYSPIDITNNRRTGTSQYQTNAKPGNFYSQKPANQPDSYTYNRQHEVGSINLESKNSDSAFENDRKKDPKYTQKPTTTRFNEDTISKTPGKTQYGEDQNNDPRQQFQNKEFPQPQGINNDQRQQFQNKGHRQEYPQPQSINNDRGQLFLNNGQNQNSEFSPSSNPGYNGYDSLSSGNPHRPQTATPQSNKFPHLIGQSNYASNKPFTQQRDEEKFENYRPITDFSWNLFKQAVNPQQPNFVISPLSPQHLLSFLASGAEGETRDEINRAISYSSPNQLNSLVSTMLREPGNKELQLASALFVSDRIAVSPTFKNVLAENTNIFATDFSNTEKFNREYTKWVSEKTKGALSNVRIKPDPSTRMLMSSAVYFKGEWIFKLNPGGIGDFYVNENTPVKVPMMKLLKKLPYGKLRNGNLGEWISLPYNSNDSMVIILPRKDSTVEDLIQNLNVQEVFDGMNSDNYGNITLTLPKFKVESRTSLVNPLQKMGIRQLFSTNAQLPRIFTSSEPLSISSVVQQASLEINEQGSIATSLTAFAVVALSFSPPTPDVEFTVDRPFVAMIIDRKNNFPYFIAKISNPAA